MDDSIENLVLDCVQRRVSVPEITVTLDSNLGEIEIDSIDFIEIIFEIEEKLDIEVDYNANEQDNIQTVRDMCDKVAEMVEKYGSDKSAAS